MDYLVNFMSLIVKASRLNIKTIIDIVFFFINESTQGRD